ALLDVLKSHGARATFFVLGSNLESPFWTGATSSQTKGILVRAMREGHLIGNHSYSHPRTMGMSEFTAEIVRCDKLITDLRNSAHLPHALIPCRLPYGLQNVPGGDPRAAALVSLGRPHFSWTKLFDDYEKKSREQGVGLFEEMKQHALELFSQGLRPVLALHDSCSASEGQPNGFNRDATLEAVSMFLAEAKRSGWSSSLLI
ncbi:MAG: polysaccharide deacetylase family protein, partial [Bdellovibrio sp.]|nr:polysaccharide deacetylase family protein [Bdellovibrio sp.]